MMILWTWSTSDASCLSMRLRLVRSHSLNESGRDDTNGTSSPAVEVEDDGDGPGRVGSAELFVTPNDPPPGLSVAPVNESIPAPASPREARPHVYFAGEPRNG